VAGPVIQATRRSEFEDGLGSGDFVSDCSASELKGDTAVSFFGGVKNCTKIVNTK
jgi:hypothetical protein